METKKTPVNYRLETVLFRTSLCWAQFLPNEYKFASSSGEFKRKRKDWQCETCFRRLCQTYHQNIGLYLN